MWLTHDKVAKKFTTSTTYQTAKPVQCKTTIQLLRGKFTIAGSVNTCVTDLEYMYLVIPMSSM